MKFYCLSCLVAFCFLSPVYGEDYTSYTTRLQQNNSWLQQLDAKMKQNKERTADLTKKLDSNRNIACRLILKRNGEIDKLTLVHSSGLDNVDNLALDLIRLSAPFELPPNDMPCKSGVNISFSTSSDRLESSLRIAPEPNHHVAEDYLDRIPNKK